MAEDWALEIESESSNNLRSERAGAGEHTISFASVWLGQIMQVIGHEAHY
jgi:hypothetical protein